MQRLSMMYAGAIALAFALLLPAPLARAEEEPQQPSGREEQAHPSGTLPHGDLRVVSHDVRVVINNGFATTEVEQVLENGSARDVEAAWAFPLPKEAALSELSVTADGTRYVGEVVEKQRARQIYAAEKQAGRTAALAEQHEYFHYQVQITRVPAGGRVHAHVVYYQALEIESGVGRYHYPLEEGNTDDMQRAFWTMDRKASQRLRLDVTLKTAFPIDKLHAPSHPGMSFRQEGEDTWRAVLDQPGAGLDRDFVLLYRLRPDVPARIELLTHREKDAPEGTFMAVVTPGSDLAPIRRGTDWVFVLDVSGSMEGEKIRLLKQGVLKAVRGLGREDRFQVVTFNGGARRVTPAWLAAEPASIAAAEGLVKALRADGSTNVHAGLSEAYALLDADRPTGLILVSDGVANVGHHHYRELIGLARKHDVRVFTFALGNSANLRVMRDMAVMSGGTTAAISTRDEIGAQLLLARDRMTHAALHGVQFELEGATVVHPKTLPNLYLGQQLVVLGRYAGEGPAKLRVKARISGQPASWEVDVDLPAEATANPELERLYAFQAIEDLQRDSWLRTGDGGEARSAIVDMALRYSLVTDYTSMIVVTEAQKAQYGIGDANARRRTAERAAAKQRATSGNRVQQRTGGTPLAGDRAAHAPSRWSRPSSGNGSSGSGSGGSSGGGSGGGVGVGALGPLHAVVAAGMAVLALRRRRRRA